MRRIRTRTVQVVLFGLAAAALLFFASPRTAPSDAALYLDRAAVLQRASTPGSGEPLWPSSTVWVSYPLSVAQRAAATFSSADSRAAYLAASAADWRSVLRLLWSLLAAALLWRAARSWASPPGDLSAGIVVAALLCAPLLSVGVTRLLPAVPAALLCGELLSRALRAGPSPRDELQMGLLGGLLLAWFPFVWPVVPLAWAIRRGSGARWAALGRALALALVLALALEPTRLRQPGEILLRAANEWRREGGGSGPGGGGVLPLLGLTPMLGLSAWLLWGPAAWRLRGSGSRGRLLAGAGLWAAAVLVPALAGVRRAGNLQWAAAPWMLAWSLSAAASWRIFAVRPKAGWIAAGLVVLAGAVPASRVWHVQTGRLEERAARVRAEARSLIPAGDLCASEIALTSGDEDSLARRVLFLPRDSRAPARYDFAYWSRWYAGFRWVLLAGGRVAENLARSDAHGPHRFYAEVERQGSIERQWGTGESGFRLYRLRDDAEWRRSFTEEELATVGGDPERAWFLSQLGSLYLNAGDPRAAEAIFRVGLRWDPNSAPLYSNLGTACLRLNDPAAAARAFESGLRLAPQSFELLWNLGLACSTVGLHERAEGVLRRAAALCPDFAPVHYELGRVFLAQGKDELARTAFRRFLELDPGSPNRAAVDATLGRLDAAGGP